MIQDLSRGLATWWRGVDRTLLVIILALIVIGLVLAMAASPAMTDRLGIEDPFYFLYRQSAFALLGVIGMLGLSLIHI